MWLRSSCADGRNKSLGKDKQHKKEIFDLQNHFQIFTSELIIVYLTICFTMKQFMYVIILDILIIDQGDIFYNKNI